MSTICKQFDLHHRLTNAVKQNVGIPERMFRRGTRENHFCLLTLLVLQSKTQTGPSCRSSAPTRDVVLGKQLDSQSHLCSGPDTQPPQDMTPGSFLELDQGPSLLSPPTSPLVPRLNFLRQLTLICKSFPFTSIHFLKICSRNEWYLNNLIRLLKIVLIWLAKVQKRIETC